MDDNQTNGEMAAPPIAADGRVDRPRLSRRQALGRVSAVATAGAVAWVVPEILTAKPAAGASLSGGGGTGSGTGTGASVGVSTSVGATGGTSPTTGASTTGSAGLTADTDPGGSSSPASLAFTGLDVKRDAEVGAALVAGGWAMHHWASRRPKPAVAVDGRADAGADAGSADTVT